MLTVIPTDPELYAEKVLDAIVESAKADIYAYIVVDSVVGLVPQKELDGSIQDDSVGLLSRKMAQGLKKLVPTVKNTKTCVIFINQTREKIGIMYGDKETTPGGKALKFYAAQRYRLTKKSQSDKKQKGVIIGHTVKVKCRKNKLGPPQREAEFPLFYTTGVDDITNLVKVGREYDIIIKEGQFYIFNGINKNNEISLKERGLDAFTKAVAKNEEVQKALYSAILEAFFAGKVSDTGSESDEEFDE